MSRVDTTFGPLAGPLVREWGLDMVLVKGGGPGAYDPATGHVTTSERRIPLKGVLLAATAKEWEGVYQEGDMKLIVDPEPVRPERVDTGDWAEIPEGGKTIRWKVVESKGYRGALPVVDFALVRRQ